MFKVLSCSKLTALFREYFKMQGCTNANDLLSSTSTVIYFSLLHADSEYWYQCWIFQLSGSMVVDHDPPSSFLIAFYQHWLHFWWLSGFLTNNEVPAGVLIGTKARLSGIIGIFLAVIKPGSTFWVPDWVGSQLCLLPGSLSSWPIQLVIKFCPSSLLERSWLHDHSALLVRGDLPLPGSSGIEGISIGASLMYTIMTYTI